jgi:hypothetical protein
VWRRSCQRKWNSSSVALTAGSQTRARNVDREMGCPAWLANSSWSGPMPCLVIRCWRSAVSSRVMRRVPGPEWLNENGVVPSQQLRQILFPEFCACEGSQLGK